MKEDPNSVDLKIAQLLNHVGKAEHHLIVNGTPEIINSEAHDSIARTKHSVWHDILPGILTKYPGYETLIDDYHFYKDQHRQRNRIMADNIVRATKEYPGKRLVVITGAEHRYILRDLLKDEKSIDLKEYWEIIEPDTTDSRSNQPVYLKTIPPDKLKEDLDFLFKTIEEVHPNMYAYTSKEEFAPRREKLYSQINRPMSSKEFFKLVAPVIASLKSFHTIILPFREEYDKYSKSTGRVFPLELNWDNSKVTLAKNYSSVLLPLGGEILTINGQRASEIFAAFSRLFASENKSINPSLVEHPVNLRSLLLLEYGPVQSWHLTIKAKDGETNSYTIRSLALEEFKTDQWAATAENKKHYRYIPEYDTGIIEFYKWKDHEKLTQFLDKTFKNIYEKQVSNLIIDIRSNTGGSDQCFHSLLEYLTAEPYKLYDRIEMTICPQAYERIGSLRRGFPDKFTNKKEGDIVTLELPDQRPSDNPFRFTGRIFLLVGRQSFSASTVFASVAKHYKIATLIGDETGDPTTLYADSIDFTLPNSGLEAFVASKLLVCPGSKNDGRGVIPDYEVKQKPEDTANGVDTVLQFTLDLIKKTGSEISSEQKQNNLVQIERTKK